MDEEAMAHWGQSCQILGGEKERKKIATVLIVRTYTAYNCLLHF